MIHIFLIIMVGCLHSHADAISRLLKSAQIVFYGLGYGRIGSQFLPVAKTNIYLFLSSLIFTVLVCFSMLKFKHLQTWLLSANRYKYIMQPKNNRLRIRLNLSDCQGGFI